jgi:aminoglycoside phosphotransferase (APT) family kinase protein
MRMHDDRLHVLAGTVAGLVAAQFPQWAGLAVVPVPSDGTVNLLFRVGEDLVARLPMQPGDPQQVSARLEQEAVAARALLGRVPVATPEPVAVGAPGPGYPYTWALYRWLPGTTAQAAPAAGSAHRLGEDLGRFVAALRRIGTGGATFAGSGRGGLLPDHDEYVARGLARSHGQVDTAALADLWSRLRRTPRREPDTMTHGDLMPGNVLVEGDRLIAVIDVGGSGPADPALDLMPAWNLLDPAPRQSFRQAVGADDEEWDRGRGWALAQAIGCLDYYRVTNPVMSRTAHRTLTALLEDARVS